VIEPVNRVPFQKDRLRLSSIGHDGNPVWTRLELATEARITPDTP